MTGLRQGELLGLRSRDVDFDARKVRVVSPYVAASSGSEVGRLRPLGPHG
jgi:integrase